MEKNNEKLSALIDNELLDNQLVDELISKEAQQALFSRYHLIGDVMRGDVVGQSLNIDISQQVMAEIDKQVRSAPIDAVITGDNKGDGQANNIIPFAKRFSQYAIAASVAAVVVLTSLITAQPEIETSSGLEVLSTVPFGGAVTPVSLQAKHKQSEQAIKKRNERLEALLKDHQLQLQTQP